MALYKNIYTKTHHIEKTIPLLFQLKRSYDLGARLFILFGPQWNRLDTLSAVNLADSLGMTIVLVEYRFNECVEWRKFKSINPIYILNYDVDELQDKKLLEFMINSNKTVIYDNLSGHHNRLKYWSDIIKYDNIIMLITYIQLRGIILGESKKLQNTIEYKLSERCSLLCMSKFNVPIVEWLYERSICYEHQKKVNEKKYGCHCPDCAIDASRLEPRKNKNPEWHCSCGWEGEFEDLTKHNFIKDGRFKSTKKQLIFRKIMNDHRKNNNNKIDENYRKKMILNLK